jgi:hypothetical protein
LLDWTYSPYVALHFATSRRETFNRDGAVCMVDDWLGEHGELARRIVIPAELKWEVRDKLDQVNLTELVLFPGLDGLTRWLVRYHAPRRRHADAGDRGTRAPARTGSPLPRPPAVRLRRNSCHVCAGTAPFQLQPHMQDQPVSPHSER